VAHPTQRQPRRPVPLRLPLRRLVRRARRSPATWWLTAAAVAAFATARVGAIDDEAEAARAAWGESTTVAVAVRDLEAGQVVGATDVVLASWPRAVVPPGSLTEVPDGRTVTAPIVAGEALASARLAPDGLSDVAALLPSGWRAVAIPATGGSGGDLPPLAVGDHVDVLASVDTFDLDDGSADPEPAGVVAEAALVLDVSESAVTVGIPAARAPDVAFAATRGSVTLALVGAG
jgi:Flp pilus assembly protein CpaB